MTVGRAERWSGRESRVVAAFGSDQATLRRVAGVFELMEMAWHDCYGEVSPPEGVIDDVLLCSGGTLEGLIDAAQLAVADFRDLRLRAIDVRSSTASTSGD